MVIGGAFTIYDGSPRNRLAQLGAGGSLDDSFYTIPPFGPDAAVQHLLIQADGKIIVSGLFDGYSGLVTGRITRLLGMTSAYPLGSPALNTWQKAPISGVGFTPRAGHAVVAVNGKIYVFG